MRTDLVIAVSAAMFIVAADPARAIVFDDGLLHVIDSGNSFPFEGVTLRNGPLSSTTTLELVDGGLIGGGTLFAEENSVVHVFGGELAGGLEVNDDSQATVSGGLMSGIRVRQNGHLDISDVVTNGSGTPHLLVVDNATVTMSGGFIAGVAQAAGAVAADAVLDVTGGEMEIGHTSCVLAECPSMGVVSNLYEEPQSGSDNAHDDAFMEAGR